MSAAADEPPRARFRWRVADWHNTGMVPSEPGAPTLELAILRAEEWLSAPRVVGAVAVIWVSGNDRGWHPVVFGIMGNDQMDWHPWATLVNRGAELVKAGGELAPAEQDGAAPNVISGFAGEDLVTVVTDPGKPSRIARMALLNAALYADEAAGQAIPGDVIDAIPLTCAPAPAAIEAPSGDVDGAS
jgi:hypothetical protein